jgi:glycosyltransferase involved in cell wall biosynthesis
VSQRHGGKVQGVRRVLFLVPGGLDRVTGGNVYDIAVIEELRARGWEVEVREPGGIEGAWDCLVVDSLAFLAGRPQVRIAYVALAHQLPSAAAGFPEPTVQERDLLRFAGLVVTASEWLRDALSGYTPADVVAIPPGRDRAWAEDGPDPGADAVLCVGNAEPGKGLPEAIEAFGRAAPADGVRLVVVGDLEVDREEGERVHAAIDACPGRVETTGVVGPEMLAALYAGSRALLTASRYEGRPIAVIEAMASGVPVVGFDVPGLRELVRPGVDGELARDGDAGDLGRRLHNVLADPERAGAMGASARERALAWPTWAETAASFADALESVVRQDTGAS